MATGKQLSEKRKIERRLISEERVIEECIISCSPHHLPGASLQRAAARGKRARGAVAQGRLPDGWALRTCTKEVFRRACESFSADVVVWQHELTAPGGAAPLQFRSMQFFGGSDYSGDATRIPLVQSFACSTQPPLHYPRTIVFIMEALLPAAATAGTRSAAVLGVGGAVAIRALASHGWKVTAVDREPAVIAAVGRFGGKGGASYVAQKADAFLADEGAGTFDAIVCDCFTARQQLDAKQLTGVAALAAPRLRAGGVFVANLHNFQERHLESILAHFGGTAWLVPVPLDAAAILVAKKEGLPKDWRAVLANAERSLPAPARAVAREYLDHRAAFPGYGCSGWDYVGDVSRPIAAHTRAQTWALGDNTVVVLPGLGKGAEKDKAKKAKAKLSKGTMRKMKRETRKGKAKKSVARK